MSTAHLERQQYEAEALKAIYLEDFQIVGSNKYLLHLVPERGTNGSIIGSVFVELQIILPPLYPDIAPLVTVFKKSGISDDKATVLQKELSALMEKRIGEEMMFELAQHAQKFLAIHSVTLYESFYEEMVSKQKLKEHRAAEARKRETQFRQKLKENEEAKVQARLKARRQQPDLSLENSSTQPDISSKTNLQFQHIRRPSVIREKCCHLCDKEVEFPAKFTVKYVQCLGCCSTKRAIFLARIVGTKEKLVVIEWIFPKGATVAKKLPPIEQEISHLSRYSESFLVKNLALKLCVSKSEQILFLAQDYVEGVSLQEIIYSELSLSEQWCRHFSVLLLNCLKFLHDNDIIHRQLRLSSVVITKDLKVCLNDFSIDKKVRDLFEPSLSPLESYPVALGRSGKKADIHRFGILFLSLFEGRIIQDVSPKVPSNLGSDFANFLAGCLHKDEKERLTVEELLSHPFLVRRPVLDPISSYEEVSVTSESDSESEVGKNEIPLNPFRSSATSRFSNEFEVRKFLGSGGFGEVLKVRNKLDDGVYAIKKIMLDTKSTAIFNKITREVQVLSRLNHENVVRYYNSWIEEYGVNDQTEDQSGLSVANSSEKISSASGDGFFTSLPSASLWSSESSFDSENSSDDGLPAAPQKQDDSEYIVFESGSEIVSSCSSSQPKSDRVIKRTIRCMYIQMEYCERSTLRSAIDNGLYKDKGKSWRMFREILEGLAHIHQQGMIHRDLKPANIFLVRGDIVKIGDFGLATTGFLAKPTDEIGSPQAQSESGNTGFVGTLLYVAPEVSDQKGKVAYDKKLDIYSLGVLFFEMSWPPLKTGMERMKIISGLRQKNIIFPLEAAEILNEKKTELIRLLLDHDPSKRPSADALLHSSLVPPPELEDATLQETIRHTLANPQSKAYKYLVTSCLGQEVTSIDNLAFDSEGVSDLTKLREIELLTNFVRSVFRKHGAVEVSVPLLTPRSGTLSVEISNQVQLMNRSGTVVTLQAHSRTSIARFIARSNLTDFRCFTVSKSYRERRVLGVHPREVREASFDIISSVNGTAFLAEAMYVAYDVLKHNTSVNEQSLCLKVGHAKLIEAVLEYTNIDLSQSDKILATFHELKRQTNDRSMIEKNFTLMGISETTSNTLLNLLESEGTVEKVQSIWRSLLRSKHTAAQKAKVAFTEILALLKYLETIGIGASCVELCSSLQIPWSIYSGVAFHWGLAARKRRSKKFDILAEGGEYGGLLSNYRARFAFGSSVSAVNASGVTIFLEGLGPPELPENSPQAELKGHLDVVVMNLSEGDVSKETLSILKDFWNAGVRAATPPPFRALEEAQVWSKEMDIPHIIATKESEAGLFRVRSWDGERFYEKKMGRAEAVDYVIRNITQEGAPQTRPEQKAPEPGSGGLGVDFVYLLEGRIASNVRRRIESQAMAAIDAYAELLSAKAQVLVFCLDVPYTVIQNISGLYPLDEVTVEKLISSYPRFRNPIRSLWENLEGSYKKARKIVYALFSVDEMRCKLLI